MVEYGKKVKEMYWPSVSEKNQYEMVKLKQKVAMLNVATKPTDLKKPSIAPSAWRAEQINNSKSQANLPHHKIEVRSHGS